MTINQISPEPDEGDEDLWGGYYDLRGMILNSAEQAEEFAIAVWHKLQSWKVRLRTIICICKEHSSTSWMLSGRSLQRFASVAAG